MTDSKKLAELKKAYAEIILNTAKEAAARVMTSEKKAERHRREVVAAKDEALRMILRLKLIMESKVKETEAKSIVQTSKIELLEAQLGEAEDIVKDLRSDLKDLQDKLDQFTKRENDEIVAEPSAESSQQMIKEHEYGSIIARNRNGGTHRVRASEGGNLNHEPFLSVVSLDNSEEHQINFSRKKNSRLASCRTVDKASDLDSESSDGERRLGEEHNVEMTDCVSKLSSEKSLKITFQRKRKMEEDLSSEKRVL